MTPPSGSRWVWYLLCKVRHSGYGRLSAGIRVGIRLLRLGISRYALFGPDRQAAEELERMIRWLLVVDEVW